MQKVLSKTQSNGLGLMERQDGSYTSNKRETLQLMLQTHFPGSWENVSSSEDRIMVLQRPKPTSEDWKRARSIFSKEKIKWAINSFKSFKSPGEDGIFPVLLQKGIEEILVPLHKIYIASLAWGHIPNAWTYVNVLFIPKVGKRPGNQPKSFRPISLTSFLLKTMEKVVDMHMRSEILDIRPLHHMQHAYQKEKSTETALYNLKTQIDRAICAKEIAVGAFLDIEGAFDNTSHQSIYQALTSRGVNNTTSRWIMGMLRNRKIQASLAGEKLSVKTNRGCPQGG